MEIDSSLFNLFNSRITDVVLEGTHLHLALENQSVWKIMCPWYISTQLKINNQGDSEHFKKTIMSHIDLQDFDALSESIIGKIFLDIYGYVFHMNREFNPASSIFPNPGIMNSMFADCNEDKMPAIKTELPNMTMTLLPSHDINWILETPKMTLICKQVDRESILEVSSK